MSRAFISVVAAILFFPCIPAVLAQTPARDKPDPTGTGIIRGLIVDAVSGEPVRKARVRATSSVLSNGRTATTDVNGRYELKTLPAGQFTVAATKGTYVSASYGQTRPLDAGKLIDVADGQIVEHIDLKLSQGGIIAGRISDEFGESMAGVQGATVRFQSAGGSRRAVSSAMRSSNDLGEFRLFGIPPGQYYLTATLPRFSMSDESANMPAYAPTYYPGTASVAEAQRLTIAAGQTVTGINMTVLSVRGMRVSGTIVDAGGRPANSGSVMLSQPMGVGYSSVMAPVKPDGTFSLTNVTPGEYVLRWMGPDPNERALMPVTVGGGDLDGVALAGVKASTISGRIVIDRAATGTLKAFDVRLNVGAARPEDVMMVSSTGPAQIKDDFTFQLKAFPGRLLISAGGAMPGWFLKTVRLNGADVTDTGFDLGTDPINGVEVELTNVVSEVSGIVSDATGSPTRNAWVIVFPQDREKWRASSRHVFPARPDPTNQYRVRALRPGAYYAAAVAVDALEAGEWEDPDMLDRLRERATTFEIGAAEKKTLNLVLTPLDR
jgi:Carboxypeptidase regulatory-like domain